MKTTMPSPSHSLLLLLLLSHSAAASHSPFPPDAVALIAFKSRADLTGRLLYLLTEPHDYCQWQGVKCGQGRVVRLALPSFGLRGSLAAASLSRLDQLRVLSLRNNSLSGPIPDLSRLRNLKSLFLSHNSFSGSFPPSLLSLRRLSVLDLAGNRFSGPIPSDLNSLPRLTELKLELNRFNASLPPLTHSLLLAFNVSANDLSGPVPATPTLSRFGPSSFSGNPGLCGELLNKPCPATSSSSPFFDVPVAPATPLAQTTEPQDSVVLPPTPNNNNKTGIVVGLVVTVVILAAVALLLSVGFRRRRKRKKTTKAQKLGSPARSAAEPEPEPAVEESRRRAENKLVFAPGEAELYGVEQLMRGSAELLGRGTVGTTYKAVLESQLAVTVKRLDGAKTAVTGREAFQRHMDSVGALRHPNLVPVRAYFQAHGERLVVFDYQANGSLYNLIHGSKTSRAKPLHWTSCLKISEDVAQGLAYIHNASKLIHGNLKSSNVLLGPDFEACLADYGLAALASPSSATIRDDPDSLGYKAPEARKAGRRASAESDVFAFGVLVLELLTGKHPSQHPFLLPEEVPDWVRATRDGSADKDCQLAMLTEVACLCSATSPEQRPAMGQVLKMIQEIKESVAGDQNRVSGYS